MYTTQLIPMTIEELKTLTIEDLIIKFEGVLLDDRSGTINTGWIDFIVLDKPCCLNIKIELLMRPQKYIENM